MKNIKKELNTFNDKINDLIKIDQSVPISKSDKDSIYNSLTETYKILNNIESKKKIELLRTAINDLMDILNKHNECLTLHNYNSIDYTLNNSLESIKNLIRIITVPDKNNDDKYIKNNDSDFL